MNYNDLSAGMEIHIGVRCHNCDAFLNTPARTPERARKCAESLGWRFRWINIYQHRRWECPTCLADLD